MPRDICRSQLCDPQQVSTHESKDRGGAVEASTVNFLDCFNLPTKFNMKERIFYSLKHFGCVGIFFCLLGLCYGDSSDLRIVGGREASRGEFPHQVSLQAGSYHRCGGAILNEHWVLTAAHCASGDLVVVAGIHNLRNPEDSEQRVDVENYVVHNYYSSTASGSSPYDIALLKLASPLQFNEYVSAIGLPAQGAEPPGHGTLSGWGSISRSEDQILPTYLQAADLSIIDLDTCTEMFRSLNADEPFELGRTNMCTGPGYDKRTSCNGDSGGPLIAGGEVIGVTSWGEVPCLGNAPSAYVKVSPFVDWIQDVISHN